MHGKGSYSISGAASRAGGGSDPCEAPLMPSKGVGICSRALGDDAGFITASSTTVACPKLAGKLLPTKQAGWHHPGEMRQHQLLQVCFRKDNVPLISLPMAGISTTFSPVKSKSHAGVCNTSPKLAKQQKQRHVWGDPGAHNPGLKDQSCLSH